MGPGTLALLLVGCDVELAFRRRIGPRRLKPSIGIWARLNSLRWGR
jgi:hypothetical protein